MKEEKIPAPWSRRRFIKTAAAAGAAFAAAPRASIAQDTVRIGFPFELSGKFVSYGASGKRGAEMALEAFKYQAGGRRIEPLFRDLQSDAQVTVSAMTELVITSGVDFIVGPIASPVVSAAIPIIKQKQPLWVVPGSSSTRLEEELGDQDYFFHTWAYAYHFHASEAAALKAAVGNNKRVAIIYSDDNYGRTHLPYVEKFYGGSGFEIVTKELVRANSTDLNPILTKISRLNASVLIGLVQTTDAVTLAKQVHTRRLNIPFLVGTSYTQLREWQAAVGEAQEGWIGVTTYIPGMERAASKDFPEIFPKLTEWATRFRQKYNIEPDFLDVLNYATTAILLIAIDRAKSADKAKVADELRKLDIDTISGRAKFIPSGGGTKQQAFTDMVVFQRQKGKNVLVYPADIANGSLQPLKA
jgi:branched-chain amino acid transport system substrate-binding protein